MTRGPDYTPSSDVTQAIDRLRIEVDRMAFNGAVGPGPGGIEALVLALRETNEILREILNVLDKEDQ